MEIQEKTGAVYDHFNVFYPNLLGPLRPVAAPTPAPRGGLIPAVQNGNAVPSQGVGVTSALQGVRASGSDSPRAAVNRRPKTSESRIAIKWTSVRH